MVAEVPIKSVVDIFPQWQPPARLSDGDTTLMIAMTKSDADYHGLLKLKKIEEMPDLQTLLNKSVKSFGELLHKRRGTSNKPVVLEDDDQSVPLKIHQKLDQFLLYCSNSV